MTTIKHLTADRVDATKVTDIPKYRSTVTGYGPKIPTRYMVLVGPRWYRVYMAQYGNSGAAYIVYRGEDHYLDSDLEHTLAEL